MQELRLIDPDGYTVPGTVHSDVPDANVETITDRLKTDEADEDAARWGHRPSDYRVQTTRV